MKINEIWKYKHWVVNLIDGQMDIYVSVGNSVDLSPAELVRVLITNIEHDVVWFREINTEDSEHNIKREAFIQIFEKVYEE
jgi:hypothetical protein